MTTPKPIQAAFGLYLFALAAGVFETALMTAGRPLSETAAPIAIRIVITTVAVVIALRMRSGRNWARITLAVALGLVGTLSLVYDPIVSLIDGTLTAPTGATEIAFTASRALHTLAVLTATTLMFHPTTHRHFSRLSPPRSSSR
ncbi:hypothetical protein [Allorhizocola rhizosphaerae]|uniref:hypothetical protein n=1 Tax=Allorhizocola rhizosphaerae TaxID=1872709 RepID=UPI000E3BA284|nr:hypothetical protein [Allorhizocola rhizosphaerae]